MDFQKLMGPKQLDWYGIINFTLAVLMDCKWHKYKYSIRISEKNKQAVWRSVTPEPEKPKAGDAKPEKPPEPQAGDAPPEPQAGDAPPEPQAGDAPPDAVPEKPPEPKPAEEPPPKEEKRKKKKGYTKGPPPPPKNSVVDEFCFFSATRVMPTSARIKILDPLSSPAKAIWAEVNFVRWLQGYPPRIVCLRPSRIYKQYRFQDYSFSCPPPPEPPKRPRYRRAR